MVELVPGTRVFLYRDQVEEAITKCAKVSKRGLTGCAGARFLLRVFFTNEELLNASLTSSPGAKKPALAEPIIQAIVGKLIERYFTVVCFIKPIDTIYPASFTVYFLY